MQDLTIHAKALLHIMRIAQDVGERLTIVKLSKYYARGKDKECSNLISALGGPSNVVFVKVPELHAVRETLTLTR